MAVIAGESQFYKLPAVKKVPRTRTPGPPELGDRGGATYPTAQLCFHPRAWTVGS